ncbi:hypothetical protein FZEAL_4060 [Fusarium zealandicum]|uniref:CENP-V/GFA domain-containing protein n=1 Tax=Fusarium zealandicum TaxID=1053134 RepID=A0A8H4UN56_9HYPO|nr:hypothetical protein FZEAL_4060 [Fusarium zealandicum]
MASETTPDLIVTAQCLCKANIFTTSIFRSNLPLKGTICHCNSCRHVTGAMYSSHVVWPGSPEEICKSKLERYKFTQNVSLRFCGTCSSPMFWEEYYAEKPEILDVLTGVLNNVQVPDFITFPYQILVGDTKDGGASHWLQHVNKDGFLSQRWKTRAGKSEQLDTSWPSTTSAPQDQDQAGTRRISIQCRCKGINFVLSPGNANFAGMEPDVLPFFVEPATHKHLASFDACNSCRSMFGVDIVNWTFALLRQLEFQESTGPAFPKSTSELKEAILSPDRDARFGTLAMYKSSPDVQRYFCSRCSASAFYAVDDRPDLVDVAVGLLDSQDGANAESFLTWNLGAKVGGEADVAGGWRQGFVESIKDTAESWRVKRKYPKTWKRLSVERTKEEDKDEMP